MNCEQIIGDRREYRLAAQEFGGQAMHRHRRRPASARCGFDIGVKDAAASECDCMSSTAPISTMRWPCAGSRPVVSVSRTISRMRLFRFARQPGDNITNLGARMIESLRTVHNEIGAPSSFPHPAIGGRGAAPNLSSVMPGRLMARAFWIAAAPTPRRSDRRPVGDRSRTKAEYRASRSWRRSFGSGRGTAPAPVSPWDGQSLELAEPFGWRDSIAASLVRSTWPRPSLPERLSQRPPPGRHPHHKADARSCRNRIPARLGCEHLRRLALAHGD